MVSDFAGASDGSRDVFGKVTDLALDGWEVIGDSEGLLEGEVVGLRLGLVLGSLVTGDFVGLSLGSELVGLSLGSELGGNVGVGVSGEGDGAIVETSARWVGIGVVPASEAGSLGDDVGLLDIGAIVVGGEIDGCSVGWSVSRSPHQIRVLTPCKFSLAIASTVPPMPKYALPFLLKQPFVS